MNDSQGSLVEHPYFPFGVDIPGYAANTISGPILVAIFAAGSGTIMSVAYSIIQRARPGLSSGQTWAALWFVLCGFIHSFFEGYFSYNFRDMASKNDIFGQLWKEYALSDSRYLTQDSFVMTMETVTAMFWGPLSFVCAYYIVTSHPLRHPLQLIISLGQFYGCVLYYATCEFSALVHSIFYSRPENFYYLAYYFLCNFFWIVIPGYLICQSVCVSKNAIAQVQKLEKARKGQ